MACVHVYRLTPVSKAFATRLSNAKWRGDNAFFKPMLATSVSKRDTSTTRAVTDRKPRAEGARHVVPGGLVLWILRATSLARETRNVISQ